MYISCATDNIMASLSHCSLVYGNTGMSLSSSAGVIKCSGGSGYIYLGGLAQRRLFL